MRETVRRRGRDFYPAPNHDRWLVSYADLITLLFALFVVLFASSNADRNKVRTLAHAVENAISHSGVGSQARGPEARLDTAYRTLTRLLKSETENQQVRLKMESRGLVITLNQTAFFQSGAAEFDARMYPTLEKIAGAIATVDNPVRLEGHTDSIPIHNDRFQNNWELSASRAVVVLRLLSERFGIAAERMAVAGYADTAPVAGNETDEGRARNRRVDVVILTRDAMRREPSE